MIGRNEHSLSIEEALEIFETRVEGLSEEEARERLQKYGPNELREEERAGPTALFIRQFASPLIYMLLVATAISLAVGEFIDAGVIMAVVLLNAVVGYIQESKAEAAIQALKELTAPRAKVRREGHRHEIPARELVPGDTVLLETGDIVPADLRLVEVAGFRTDESALTGESQPVPKSVDILPGDIPLPERVNMVWMGTASTHGRALGMVVATGMSTQMGKIAESVQEVKQEDTPLQRRMNDLTHVVGYIALGFSALIFLGGLLRAVPIFEIFLFAIAAAVAAVPEGLPATVTIVLALGLRRMVGRHVIVRKLPAVETLGSATFICSDKTGTLTRNEMTVKSLYVGDRMIRVSGEGYVPHGQFYFDHRAISPGEDAELLKLFRIAVLASDAHLRQQDSRYSVIGDPTEGALVVAAAKAGMMKEQMERAWPRLDEIPFESELGYMATLNVAPDGRRIVHVKGAPERVLELAKFIRREGKVVELTREDRERRLLVNREMSGEALRVLAFGYVEVPDGVPVVDPHDLEAGLVFAGMMGMLDPLREEAREAVRAAKSAGIKVAMITGDSQATARAIGDQLTLSEGEVITGPELARLDEEELARRIENVTVYARVEPVQKLRIVRALKRRGEIVAMTGDGVNDAPALKAADIGVAMGMMGTDVAREAADMVLTDDDFASIVAAVEEGRVIFSNLKRVVFYLLSTNTGEILVMLLSLIVGLPLPLIAVQVLFINLVTDAFYDIGLAVEPKHADVLHRPPRRPDEPLISRKMLYRFALVAVPMSIGTLSLFIWQLPNGLDRARTFAFIGMAMFQWFNAFNARSESRSLLQLGVFSNKWLVLALLVTASLQASVVYLPPLQVLFRTVPLGGVDWLVLFGVTVTILIVEEVRKRLAPNLFS